LLHSGSADKTVKFWDLETFELIGSTGPEVNWYFELIIVYFLYVCNFRNFSIISLKSNLGGDWGSQLYVPSKKEMEKEHKLRSPCLVLLYYTTKSHMQMFCSIIQFDLGTYLIHLNYFLCFHEHLICLNYFLCFHQNTRQQVFDP